MKSVLRILTVVAVLLLAASPAMAQTTDAAAKDIPTVKASNPGPGMGAGIGMGLSILGAGVGLGLIGFSALSGIARQPEQLNSIRGVMILMAALVEGSAIISLVLCLLLVIL